MSTETQAAGGTSEVPRARSGKRNALVSPLHGARRAILVGWLPSRQPHSSWVAAAFSEPPRWACCARFWNGRSSLT